MLLHKFYLVECLGFEFKFHLNSNTLFLAFWPLSFLVFEPAVQALQLGSSLGATRSTRTSRRSSLSRSPCGAQLPRVYVYVFTLLHTLYQTFCH